MSTRIYRSGKPLESKKVELFDGDPWFWFAVQRQSRRETGVRTQLNNQGDRVFQSRIKTTHNHTDKIENILDLFFPRDLYIILNMWRDQWRSVSGAFGLAQRIMRGERPLPVTDGIIEPMIKCLDERGLKHAGAGKKLHIRQNVEITAGPLSTQIGEIERLNAGARVQFLLEFIGQATRIKISSEDQIPTTP